MDRILFIINPIAGGGKAKNTIPIIKEFMENSGIDYDLILTKGPEDAISLSKKGLQEGYNKIVAVGGDGTVNEVALGIVEFGQGLLGIIPCGTGNDLARTLAIPTSIEDAINTIVKGLHKRIDIGKVDEDLFLNISSIGFDAEVVKTTEKIKKVFKSNLAYGAAIFFTLINIKAIRIVMEINRERIEKDIFLMAVGNGKYYGGGLKILPMALIDDGYFHICIVNKMSKLKLLILLPTLFKGEHIKHKEYVEIYKVKRAKVTTSARTYLNIDGEVQDIRREIDFTVAREQLSILVAN